MEHLDQLFKDLEVISKKNILLLQSLLFISFGAVATTDVSCYLVEQSAEKNTAVTSSTSVIVAINANNRSDSEANRLGIIKRKLQAMFLNYCKDFSGYSHFQVETKLGVSRGIKCNGIPYYVYSVKKSNINITQLSSNELASSVSMPELMDKDDVFEEFK